jgi:hypothetical protein
MSTESYGRLGTLLMDLVRHNGCEAAMSSEFNLSCTQLVSRVLRECVPLYVEPPVGQYCC